MSEADKEVEEPSDKVVEEDPAGKVIEEKPLIAAPPPAALQGCDQEEIIYGDAAIQAPQVETSEDVENSSGRSEVRREEAVESPDIPNVEPQETACLMPAPSAPPPGLGPAPPPPKSFAIRAPKPPDAQGLGCACGAPGLVPQTPSGLSAADHAPSVPNPPSCPPPPAQAFAKDGSNCGVAGADVQPASLPLPPCAKAPPSQSGSEGAAIEFDVIVHTTDSSSLGIGVACTADARTETTTNLFINSVLFEGNGLIPNWNRTCPPEHQVAPGDAIVAVNGVRDPSSMIAELRHRGELVISIRRGGASMLAQIQQGQMPQPSPVQARSAPQQQQPQPQQQQFPRQQPQQEQLPPRQQPVRPMQDQQQQQRQELQQRRQQQQRQQEVDPMQQWREHQQQQQQQQQQFRHQGVESGRPGLRGGYNDEIEENADMGLLMALNDLSDMDFAGLVCALAFKRRSLRPIVESGRTMRPVLPSF